MIAGIYQDHFRRVGEMPVQHAGAMKPGEAGPDDYNSRVPVSSLRKFHSAIAESRVSSQGWLDV